MKQKQIRELLPPMEMIQGFIDTAIWIANLPWLNRLILDVNMLSDKIYDLEWKITEKNMMDTEECIRP